MFIQVFSSLKHGPHYQLIGDNDEPLGMLTLKQVSNLIYEDVEVKPFIPSLTPEQRLYERMRAVQNSIL